MYILDNIWHYRNVIYYYLFEKGERIWPFPIDEDFEEDLKSDIADILQVIYYRGGMIGNIY